MKTRPHRILAALAGAPDGKLRLPELCSALGTEKNGATRNYTALMALRGRGCVTKEEVRGGYWAITRRGRLELQHLEDSPGPQAVRGLRSAERRYGTSLNALGRPLSEAPIVVIRPAVDGEAPRGIPNSAFALAEEAHVSAPVCVQGACSWDAAACAATACAAKTLRDHVTRQIWARHPDSTVGLPELSVIQTLCDWRQRGALQTLRDARRRLDLLIQVEEGKNGDSTAIAA